MEIILTNLEREMERGEPVNDFYSQMQEENHKIDLISIYSKKYLLNNDLLTKKEYRLYKKKGKQREQERLDELADQNAIAQLMHQVVGAEMFNKPKPFWRFRR